MKKENHGETPHNEKKNEPHFATKWMTDMTNILHETYKKQIDIGFDRLNMLAKNNISFFSGVFNTFKHKPTDHQKEIKGSNYWETDFDEHDHKHKDHSHDQGKDHARHQHKKH